MAEAAGVREFYAGRSVLITGATGYLGKVTVEKLLRSCPEINNVYVLVRPKQGKSPEERLSDLVNSRVFDRLRKERCSSLSKIALISGNIGEDGLGMDAEDVAKLTSEVSVIIHNAATIRFTEPLKTAVKINVCGLREMLRLAKQMKNLKAFVHISTAYSNCNRKRIDEKIYPQRLTPQQLISATTWMEDSEVEIILPRIISGYPNTYTFTKAMGELLLEDEKGSIPAAIVRPSIIVSSYSDPVPGWIEGLAGANGAFALQGLGILRTMLGHYENIGDLIPVDMTANCSIVAGWMVARQNADNVFVINMTSGQLKPITWASSFENWTEQACKYPCKNVVRPPTSRIFASNQWLKTLYQVMDHYVPGLVFDCLAKLTGQPAMYCKTLKNFSKFIDLLEFFASNEWHFENTNLRSMYDALSHNEQMIFNFDITCVDWREFTHHWWFGIRQYVWKENTNRQHEYDRRFSRIVLRRRIIRIAFGVITISALVRCFSSSHLPILHEIPLAGRMLTNAKYVFFTKPKALLHRLCISQRT